MDKINKKLITNTQEICKSYMNNTAKMDVTKMGKSDLLKKCIQLGLQKCSSKNKAELIDIINNSNNLNNDKTNKTNKTNSDSETLSSCNLVTSVTSDNIDLLAILNKLLEKNTVKNISERLNLASGTLTRWIELNDIPKSYEFDLLKMADIKIDYSKYSSKQKDQFFTPVNIAKDCVDIFCEEIKKYNENVNDFTFIEPSAGDGSFLKVLPLNTIAMDIEPRHANIVERDYLDWKPTNTNTDERYVVFGNPPFGLRGHQALKFINHSYDFAEYVCFILPQLFESDGKGVPRKRVKGYHLIYSKKIENASFYEPNANEIKINTIFQIWSKHQTSDEYNIKDYANEKTKMKIYSMSNGGTVATTRNKDMIGKCDIYIPSTCFGKENMKCYQNFDDLPGKKGYGLVFHANKDEMIFKMFHINWNDIAFLSTNSAYNLRSSQIYSLFDL
jgi:hypothetical protein